MLKGSSINLTSFRTAERTFCSCAAASSALRSVSLILTPTDFSRKAENMYGAFARYTFSIRSGEMYSPCASFRTFFLRLEPAIFVGPLTNSSPLGYGLSSLIRNSDGATVASRKVAYCLGERDGVCFSQTVSLREVIGKHHAQELMKSWVQRRRARDHCRSPVQAKRTRHLPGPNAVIQHMSASTLAALIAPPKRLNNRGTLLKMVGRSSFISSTSSRTLPWKYPIAEPPQRADCSVMRSKI
ncbi:hypothetical protein KC367_g164 [Hortaea werneckii]|nr:hypothetical protein KC367_g164 [Hortaea werneckii]